MCLLLALRAPAAEPVLHIAANRDERLDRPWLPPRGLRETPQVLGGRDLLGGGSWLAVNLDAGFVVAVTNARLGAPPGERSRGELVVDAAAQESLAAAAALLGEVQLDRYGPFNLLIADAGRTLLATNHPEPLLLESVEAVVAIGNEPLAEPGERVLLAAAAARRALDRPASLGESLVGVISDHDGADPVCRHGDRYGTVCSTLLVLAPGRLISYEFAPGPPCRTPFSSVAPPAPLK